MMNLKQTKLVGLTMELDLKTREYKMLCERLENIKQENIDENDARLLSLRDEFLKNYNEISEINKQIKEIEDTKETEILLEQYGCDDIFKYEENIIASSESNDIVIKDNKKNIFKKILYRIKEILGKS